MKSKYLIVFFILFIFVLSSCIEKENSPPSNLVIKADEINLLKQVKKPVGSYSAALSRVPGFPIELAFKNSKINIEVDYGNILLWGDDNNHKVINKGKSITIDSPITVYWSPLDGESSDPNKAIMKISFITEGQSVFANIEFDLNSSGSYTATLSNWSTNDI